MNYQNSQELTIEQALSRAKKAANKGKIADAMKLYTAVLAHQPNHPIATKRLRKLQKELPQNQSVDTETSNPPQDQVTALVNLYSSGQLTKTEHACRDLLQIYPQSLVVIGVLGAALSGQGKLKESIQVNDKAIQLKPDFATPYYNKGVTLEKLEQLDQAVESYNKAIQLKPDFAEAYSNRGNVLQQLGQLDKALKSYEKAIQLKPDYAMAYSNRGNALIDLGQLDKAVASCNKAIQLKPDYAEAHNNRGVALRDMGLLDEALRSFDKGDPAQT